MTRDCAGAGLNPQTEEVKLGGVGTLEVMSRLVCIPRLSEIAKVQTQMGYLPADNSYSTARIQRALQ